MPERGLRVHRWIEHDLQMQPLLRKLPLAPDKLCVCRTFASHSQCTIRSHPCLLLCTVIVEASQRLFYLRVFRLDGIKSFLDATQTLCIIRLIDCASVILVSAIMLNLFARILDLRQSQGSRRTFQKVTLRAELCQIPILPVCPSVISRAIRAASETVTNPLNSGRPTESLPFF